MTSIPRTPRLLAAAALSAAALVPVGAGSASAATDGADSPRAAYAGVVAAVRDRDVPGFRDLVAGDRVGAEVGVRGCPGSTLRPGRIVRCVGRAAEQERLRLPASPDRLLSLRSLTRLEYPRASSPRRLDRLTRGLARELGSFIGEPLRPRDVKTAQVDDATRPGVSLEVILACVDGAWGVAFVETRDRGDQRR